MLYLSNKKCTVVFIKATHTIKTTHKARKTKSKTEFIMIALQKTFLAMRMLQHVMTYTYIK